MQRVEILGEEVVPCNHGDVGDAAAADELRGFGVGGGAEDLGGVVQAVVVFPVKRADGLEAAVVADAGGGVGAGEQDDVSGGLVVVQPLGDVAVEQLHGLAGLHVVF